MQSQKKGVWSARDRETEKGKRKRGKKGASSSNIHYHGRLSLQIYIEDLGSIAGSNMVFSHLQKQAKHIYFTFYFYILLLVASQAKKQTK